MTDHDPLNLTQLLDLLKEMLPNPVKEEKLPQNTTRLIGGNPGEVVVDIDPQSVIVSEYAETQESDTAAVLLPLHLGTLNWNELPAWTARRILEELTVSAATGRREKFRECLRCKKEFPPEQMASDNICKSCEAQEEGVVY